MTIILGTSLIIALIVGLNLYRSRRFDKFSLSPNCLITRHRIVFLQGRPSLFYFSKYWNEVPHYLKEHGYEVFEAPYWKPFDRARRKNVLPFLDQLAYDNQKAHFVASLGRKSELDWLNSSNHPAVASCTLIATESDQSKNPVHSSDLYPQSNYYNLQIPKQTIKTTPISLIWSLLLKAHRVYTREQNQMDTQTLAVPHLSCLKTLRPTLLKHMISLAEKDLRCSH